MLRHQLREARDEGFTLTELLIVIVVLGILASIVVVGVASFRGDATQAACKAEAKTVALASDAYYAKNGAYAKSIAGNTALTLPSLVSTQYLKAAPVVNTSYTINYNSANGVVSVALLPGFAGPCP